MSKTLSESFRDSFKRNKLAWQLVIAGLLICDFTGVLRKIDFISIGVGASLSIVGLVILGLGIARRLRSPLGATASDRHEPALMVMLGMPASFGAWRAVLGWDSLQMLLVVMMGLALAGGILILLSATFRKVIVSLMILFHFGGIMTATTSVAAGDQAPWLPIQVWTYVYRPYLHFMYLNNAYHFYSPEPGPPTLVWFRIEYEAEADGETKTYSRWVRLVDRKDFSSRLHYQRLLAMTESLSVYSRIVNVQPGKLQALKTRRDRMDNPQKYNLRPEWWRTNERPKGIPYLVTVADTLQYRQLNELANLYLSSYIQHVAHFYPCEEDPNAVVKSVKVYELIHRIITPTQLLADINPLHPIMYSVYFLGEYSPDGELQKPKMSDRDRETHPNLANLEYHFLDNLGNRAIAQEPIQDLYLYWMLPVYRLPKVEKPEPNNPDHWQLIDSLQLHTGDSREKIWKR